VAADSGVRRVLDEHPAGTALLHADQVGSGEPAQPFSQGRPADPELLSQLVLGPDPVAGEQPPALDVHPDLVRDLLAGVGMYGFEPGFSSTVRSFHEPRLWRRAPSVRRFGLAAK
jgi:hypothetical protein